MIGPTQSLNYGSTGSTLMFSIFRVIPFITRLHYKFKAKEMLLFRVLLLVEHPNNRVCLHEIKNGSSEISREQV